MNEFYLAQRERGTANAHAFQLATPLADQLDLFADATRWPRKPYCTDALERGIRPRSLASALRHPYIQANPPHLRVWSIYDVDRPGGGLAWETDLPPPNWTTVNRENAHAHLVWGLSVPVLVESPDAKRAPIRYLTAIEAAFRAHLQADSGYGGLITKNPAHPMWRTWRGPTDSYELGYLAEWVDLTKHLPRQGTKFVEIGLGRNCTLFDFLRKWAYQAVRTCRHLKGDLSDWRERCYERALHRNADFPSPLDPQEVQHIATSVAKWTWKRDAAAEQAFRERQAFKGKRGGVASGVARLKASEDKRTSARLMAGRGLTQKEIAVELGASQQSVSRWLSTHEA